MSLFRRILIWLKIVDAQVEPDKSKQFSDGLNEKSEPSEKVSAFGAVQKKRQELNRTFETGQTALEKALSQAETWRNRAAMASRQSNLDLAQQALTRMWNFQVEAANIQGVEPPAGPPDAEEFFRGGSDGNPPDTWPDEDPPWRPFDPSRVPKKPFPSSGGSTVAPPRPGRDRDSDSNED